MHWVFVTAYACFVNQVAQKINYAKNLNDEVQQTVKVELKEPTTPV